MLVEGLFALYLEAVRERADLKVFVDLESDERLARRIVKFMAWGGHLRAGHQPVPGLGALPPQRAGGAHPLARRLVLNGTLDSHKGVAVLEGYLRQQLGCLS